MVLVGNAFLETPVRGALRTRNPGSPPRKYSPYTLAMDAKDRLIAWLPPEDITAALRLLKVLEDCRQMSPTEAEGWRRRIKGWARFHQVDAETAPNA